jgi:adenylate cyclase
VPAGKIKKYLGGTLIFLTVAVVCGLLAWWNPLEKQQLYLSNFLYYERPTKHQVVVVAINDETVSDEGLGKFNSWCRTYYIPVLEKLAEYKPAVVGMDILFLSKSEGLCKDDLNKVLASPDPNKELIRYSDKFIHPDDMALGESIKLFQNLILASRAVVSTESGNIELKDKSNIQDPLPIIATKSQVGHNRLFLDTNGLIRTMPPVLQMGEEYFPSFVLNIVLNYLKFTGSNTFTLSDSNLEVSHEDKVLNIPLSNYQMLINYNERPILDPSLVKNTVIIPFIDLYNNKQNYSSIIKDKIVLIGARYSSSEDKYQTPIDPTNEMHGVMIHAQAIQTILDQAWLRNVTPVEQAGLIILMTLLALAIVFGLRIYWALPLLAAQILLYGMVAAPLMFRSQGIILNLVYPPLAVILAAITGYAYRYLTEFAQKKRVAGALGQYVNETVARDVLQSDAEKVETSGEKREITVIFTDIRSFTSISESLQPQSLVALLNEYFEAMAEVILKNNGIIDKYEGDALMAVFEDRQGQPDQACRAAQAALDMHMVMSKLNAKWKNDGPLPGGEKKPEIDFRAGISTGEAIVGNIGSSRHLQYTVIGDIVNLGSRLESANKTYHTGIMVAEATYERIKDHYECRFLDMIKVKGKNKPVKTYELICPKGQLSGEQFELIQAYNRGLVLYFERNFSGALEVFQTEVFSRWPADYLTNLYAGRCELMKVYPPKPDWDFVYKMESK